MKLRIDRFPNAKPEEYQNIRTRLQSGDLLLCSGTAVFSRLIQKATESVWSHVGFIIRLDAIDRVMVLESVEPVGVRTVPLSHYVRNYRGDGIGYPGKVAIARHDRISDVSTERMNLMSRFAVDLFGYPYDKDEILRIAARIGRDLLGFTKTQVRQDREYICSEYVWECFERIGVRIPYDRRGFIAPKDFVRDAAVKGIAVVKVE
jgi:uncharacterized protein YycO